MTRVITIFADGACSGNPGPGGWAAIISNGADRRVLTGGEEDTTNNRMELLSAINALASLPPNQEVMVYMDSSYVVKGMNEWISRWQKRGWRNSQKQAVKNRDLWERLLELSNRHRIQWQWVKGHSDVEEHNEVDRLARSEAEKYLAE